VSTINPQPLFLDGAVRYFQPMYASRPDASAKPAQKAGVSECAEAIVPTARLVNSRFELGMVCLGFLSIFLFFAGLTYLLSDDVTGIRSLLGAAALAGLGLVLTAFARWNWLSGQLAVGSVAFQCLFEMSNQAGLDSSTTPVLILIVPASILIVGTRTIGLWSAVVFAGLLGVATLDYYGAIPESSDPPHINRLVSLLVLCTCITSCSVMAWYFARQANRSMVALHQERNRFQHRANHDHLTNLPNRAQFEIRGAQILAQATQVGHTATIIFLDINGFKQVNDTYGHACGDALLVAFATRINARVDSNDVFARLAGDEFALIASTKPGDNSVQIISERILDAIAEPFELESQTISVGTSIGAASFPDDGRDITQLLRIADARMYVNKNASSTSIDRQAIIQV